MRQGGKFQKLSMLGLGLLILMASASAFALQSVYRQDEARNPSASQWTPKRFGFVPQKGNFLPGTKKTTKKCIPNGQARCMPQLNRPNPFVTHSGMASSDKPSRSGITATPVVKTFNFDDYLTGTAGQ